MKNQYFGDVRDLFKFDLAEFILKFADGCSRLFYVPMLTPNDNTNHGNNRNYSIASAGSANISMIEFFQAQTSIRNKRNIITIQEYFSGRQLTCEVFNPSIGFSHDSRELYFSRLPTPFPSSSLILVDPDVGLESKTSSEKHIRFFELWYLHRKMDLQSSIMLIQFFNFQNRAPMLANERRRLNAVLDVDPLIITDNRIAFFFLPKDTSQVSKWSRILADYRERNPSLSVW